MPKTITITKTVYTFKELLETDNQRAIERARNWLIEVQFMFEWWESTYEDAERIGLNLDGFDLDRNRHAEGKFIGSARECAEKIIKEHGLLCETWIDAEVFLKEFLPLEKVLNALKDDDKATMQQIDAQESLCEECENEFLLTLLQDYSLILQKESEYLSSEEALLESAEANNYEFDEEGRIV